jgi:hypothetical protein
MEKEKVYEYFRGFEKYSIHTLKWDRGNGELERMVRFDGFDEEGNLKLTFPEGETQLDIEKIGGYNSIISAIISVSEECPDGVSPGRK